MVSREAALKSPEKKGGSGRGLRRIEIMDTTLRDGEQTEGISMTAEEKLLIGRHLLEKVRVDRIEVASARVSEGEHGALQGILDWAEDAGLADRVEALGFVDKTSSVDWVRSAGGRVINLLAKGSLQHCREQLRRTPEEHLRDIERTVAYGTDQGMSFNIYLEDWSNGMLTSPAYVVQMLEALSDMPFQRIALCDTLGILNPGQVRSFVDANLQAHPEAHFDFHGHNDYGLATANSLAAVQAGAHGLHVTVNGMGERAGNTSLDEIVVALRDHAGATSGVREKSLREVSRLVQVFTGKRIAANKPISGEDVFTHTAGIHADGDRKANLYDSPLKPARFGQARVYALGKLMGKASLDLNLEKLNIELNDEQKDLVAKRVAALSEQKKSVTATDLPFIIADVLQSPEYRVFEVKDYSVVCNRGLRPTASILVRLRDEEFHSTASGDGGYDAFMRALKALEKSLGMKVPRLVDYEVHIPPGGRTDALVETTITWEDGFKTRSIDSDQVAAAIEATAHMMNLLALRRFEGEKARTGEAAAAT